MKNIIRNSVIALAFCAAFAACDSNDYKHDNEGDTTGSELPIPPPDNSSATNQSMADTAFSNQHPLDSIHGAKDSTQMPKNK